MTKKEWNIFELGKMTTYEFKELLQEVEVAILPIGSNEQHSSNTTLNTDSVLAENVALHTAQLMNGNAIVLPTIPVGVSYHHMAWNGTMTISPKTLEYILIDYVESLKIHGLKRFVFLNGHGGNKSPLSSIAYLLRHEYNVHALNIFYWDLAKYEINKTARTKHFGHACEIETSFAKYLAPQIVRENCLQKGKVKNTKIQDKTFMSIDYPYKFEEITEDGSLGNAKLSNYQDGERLIKLICDRLHLVLEEYISEMK